MKACPALESDERDASSQNKNHLRCRHAACDAHAPLRQCAHAISLVRQCGRARKQVQSTRASAATQTTLTAALLVLHGRSSGHEQSAHGTNPTCPRRECARTISLAHVWRANRYKYRFNASSSRITARAWRRRACCFRGHRQVRQHGLRSTDRLRRPHNRSMNTTP